MAGDSQPDFGSAQGMCYSVLWRVTPGLTSAATKSSVIRFRGGDSRPDFGSAEVICYSDLWQTALGPDFGSAQGMCYSIL